MMNPVPADRYLAWLEQSWHSMIAISHNFYFAWLKTAREFAPNATEDELATRFYQIVGEDTARLYREKLGLDGTDPAKIAKAFARSSEIMGEEARVETDGAVAYLVHTQCPWLADQQAAGVESDCQAGCDAWFVTAARALSPALHVETEEAMPKGASTCRRRIWVEQID